MTRGSLHIKIVAPTPPSRDVLDAVSVAAFDRDLTHHDTRLRTRCEGRISHLQSDDANLGDFDLTHAMSATRDTLTEHGAAYTVIIGDEHGDDDEHRRQVSYATTPKVTQTGRVEDRATGELLGTVWLEPGVGWRIREVERGVLWQRFRTRADAVLYLAAPDY